MKNFQPILLAAFAVLSLAFVSATPAQADCQAVYPGTQQLIYNCAGDVFYRGGGLAWDQRSGRIFARNGAILRDSLTSELRDVTGRVAVESLSGRVFHANGRLAIDPQTAECFYPSGAMLMRAMYYDALYTENGQYSPAAVTLRIPLADGADLRMRFWGKAVDYRIALDLGDGITELQATSGPVSGNLRMPLPQMLQRWAIVQKGF